METMKNKLLLAIGLLIFFSSTAMGQDGRTIRGSVIDSEGKPLPGVNV